MLGTAVSRLWLALDEPGTKENAYEILDALAGKVGTVKVNSAWDEWHTDIIKAAVARGFDPFVDVKLHDIPDTVRSRVKRIRQLGVRYVTIHLSGGSAMIRAAVAAANEEANQPPIEILGITVLTSINESTLGKELRVSGTVLEQVLHLAQLGRDNGVNGFICSGLEVAEVRKLVGPEKIIGVPGIRFPEEAKNDQERVVTPGLAIEYGASAAIMGRSLVKGGSAAAERALDEIQQALDEIAKAA